MVTYRAFASFLIFAIACGDSDPPAMDGSLEDAATDSAVQDGATPADAALADGAGSDGSADGGSPSDASVAPDATVADAAADSGPVDAGADTGVRDAGTSDAAPGMLPIGAPCDDNSACASGECATTRGRVTFPGGACTASCVGNADCPAGSACLTGADFGFCNPICMDSSDCRDEYACLSGLSDEAGVSQCAPPAPR